MKKELMIHDDRTNQAMKGIKVIIDFSSCLDGEVEYFEELVNLSHFKYKRYKVRKSTKVDSKGIYYCDGFEWIKVENNVFISRKKLIRLLQ